MTEFSALPLPQGWDDLPFFATDWPVIARTLAGEPWAVLPPPDRIFAALAACPPERTRVVILGQDPYPTPGHANGLAFSVTPETPLPRSLVNIFREMTDDLGACPPDGDLRFWADQGVLLMNTSLTVPAGQAGGHARLGWQALTRQVLVRLNASPVAFILWGNHAQGVLPVLTHPDHLLVRSAHPSPLSARRGFFGSRPFSRVNDWLKAKGETPINWTTPGKRP